ncbi:hypothetical protein [Amycolatopsis sp.]|uniref:hypothetical protein n=1 Tax=Amycolatopsis sp. TaxID=37632 RepID=UPI002D809557|nr:hypothetical protein [Amycolatopsis sp.]HET6709997.1 hypothetical protein [Amycolatopsis sp.]
MISGKRLARTVAAAAIVLATTVAEPAAVAAQPGETPASHRIERSPCRPATGPCPCGVLVKRITTTVNLQGPAAGTVYGLVPLTLCVQLLDARLALARPAPGA